MGILDKLIGRLFKEKAAAVIPPSQPRQEVSNSLGAICNVTVARQKHFAPTFGTPPRDDESTENLIFEPATQQYRRAFRRGDPVLPPDEMERWHAARREVMRHLLDVVSGTEWAGHLVLRGSLALKAACGTEAREPGDIDWVVRPSDLRMDQPEAHRLLDGILRVVAANTSSHSVKIDAGAVVRNDIWTYERAPGHRIAFPWSCGSLPPSLVQMDFVFEQKLHVPPSVIRLTLGDLPEVPVLAASNEESLAWKLLWLFSDIYPQGKDLYDAVLLAERTPLRSSLLKTVLEDAGEWNPKWISETFPLRSACHQRSVDWENFRKECPWVEGTCEAWVARLQKAIAAAVSELGGDSKIGGPITPA
jgi:hypothetical protein